MQSGGKGVQFSDRHWEKARTAADTALKELRSQLSRLSAAEADTRLRQSGPNEIAREKRQSALMRQLLNFKNPLAVLLLVLGVVFVSDGRSAGQGGHLCDGAVGPGGPDPGRHDLVLTPVRRMTLDN